MQKIQEIYQQIHDKRRDQWPRDITKAAATTPSKYLSGPGSKQKFSNEYIYAVRETIQRENIYQSEKRHQEEEAYRQSRLQIEQAEKERQANLPPLEKDKLSLTKDAVMKLDLR